MSLDGLRERLHSEGVVPEVRWAAPARLVELRVPIKGRGLAVVKAWPRDWVAARASATSSRR